MTGAAGFIGGAVARDALARGDRVAAIGHGLDRPPAWDPRGAVLRIAGTVGPATLDRLPEPPDLVVHCAGGANVQASIADPEGDRLRTVASTVALAGWLCAQAPAARVVYPSSGAVYGQAAGRPEGRGSACTPISPYGLHKAAAEAALAAAAARGLAVAIVRLFSVYGPGLRKQLLWDACGKMRAGRAEFFGTGQERRDFVHVDDVVSLLRLAGGAARPGAALVADGGTGKGVAVREILALLAQGFDPAPAVRFLGTARSGDPTDMIADPAAARALGWLPRVPLDAGLGAYARWYATDAASAP